MIPTFAGFNLGLSTPAVPALSYTAQSTFTITNYDATLTYVVVGATPSGNQLTSVTNNSTITAAYSSGAPVSAASIMNVLAHARVLTGGATGVTTQGCGPRPTSYCPSGMITGPDGSSSGAGGSVAPDGFCDEGFGAYCDPGNCYQNTLSCYNWYWTNYTGNGYTLISSVWGKATNS